MLDSKFASAQQKHQDLTATLYVFEAGFPQPRT